MNIEKIASLARVSTATVSRVLNGSPVVRPATAERVRRVIEEAGYVRNLSARALSSGRTNLFGAIISDIKNPYFPELVSHFENLCFEQGYDALIANTNYDPARLFHCLQRMIERRVDGVAILTSEMDDKAMALLRRHKVPVVTLAYGAANPAFHSVQVDYSLGLSEAVTHLTALGHRDIAFISGPQNLYTSRLRKDLFLEAITRAGLKVMPSLVLEGDSRVEGGHHAMQRLLASKRRPTVVMCSNDLTALGAMRAVHEAGLSCPRDISISGLDDIEMGLLSNPQLTTIRIPREEIATKVFLTLLSAGRDVNVPRRETIVPTRLVIRESTAAPRK